MKENHEKRNDIRGLGLEDYSIRAFCRGFGKCIRGESRTSSLGMKGYVSQRIWLTTDKKKYAIVRVYPDRESMRAGYKAFRPNDKNHESVLGAHCGYEKFKIEPGKRRVLWPETGTVFLSKQDCGAGVVAHELMHAVIWAKTHKKNWKDQYPFIIKGNRQEEELLHNMTYAISQFYTFYWKKLDKPA